MRIRLPIVTAVVCLSFASPGESASAPATSPMVPLGPVIVRIVQRHQVIVTRAGPHGPTYSLESRGGELLSPDMTLDQLAVRNPNLYGQIRTMDRALTWAGVQD